MKKIYTAYLFVLLLGCMPMYAQSKYNNQPYNKGINITPWPLEMREKEGTFTFSPKTQFVVNDKDAEKIALFFAKKISRSTGFDIKLVEKAKTSSFIKLEINKNLPMNEEGYILNADKTGVNIQAKTDQGLFYGMQTLMQLLPAEIESKEVVRNIAWIIPAIDIKDEPRFKYRGQHFDPCRHFADVNYIKKQLDVLALYKINKFHWHLTDDQGWRIEIKKYPKLTEISSKRVEGEGNTYGPFFYTQDQIKEVVAYAKERFIEVIPEIELPGHGVAALTAYPEYSCTGGPFEVRNIWGVSSDVYCGGNEGTYEFLTDIIEEMIPLFESDYIHIGGDECPKDRWKVCPKCQAKIKQLGLVGDKDHTAEQKLQSYFIKRIEAVLLKHNKKMIGWDEILEGGLAPSATVMSWRGEKGGINAGNMGHDVIMTPGNWLYLDHYQGDSKISPVSIGNYTPLEETYSYEPVPDGLADDKLYHILGAQANVWSEYLYSDEIREWRTYPRVIALAELTWTAKDRKDYKDFERRIENQRVRLDMHDINYYIPQPEQITPSCNFVAFTDSTVLEFKTTEPVKMVYTINSDEPGRNSTEYTVPLVIKESAILKIRSVLPSGKMGNVRTIMVEKQNYAPAIIMDKAPERGLKAKYYKGIITDASMLEGKNPDETEKLAVPQDAKYRVAGGKEIPVENLYNTVLTGFINIPADGVYYFSTDVEEFWLDNKLFISNHNEVKRHSRNDKSIALAKGLHPIKIIRLCNIIGGWPPLWDKITVSIRKENEPGFKVMDESYFAWE